LKIVASCVGGAGLLAVAAVVVMAWANHAGPSAPPPAPPSPPELHQDIPVSQPRTVMLPGDSQSSEHIKAFGRTGGIGEKVILAFGDGSTNTCAGSEASTKIQQQTGKTIEQLEKESGGR
jgi:hypothetical protein